MGTRVIVPVAAVVLFLLASPSGAASATELYWQSRPFSFWVEALSADDVALRERAAQSVAALAMAHGGDAVARALPALTTNLTAPDAIVRESAAGALEQMGPTARSATLTLLQLFVGDEVLSVRRRAGLALGRIGASAPDVITEASRVLRADREADMRASAAILLSSSTGVEAARAVPSLTEALGDDDPLVQLYSATALANLGQRSQAMPVLLGLLQHDDGPVRAEAAGLLLSAATNTTDVVQPLTDALQDPDPEVRAAAAGALGTIGRPARSALRPLWLLLHDTNEVVRERVLAAIHAIRKK
jgi:HEAT repeat protein